MKSFVAFTASILALFISSGTVAAQSIPTVKFTSIDREFYIARSRAQVEAEKKFFKRVQTAPLDDVAIRAELVRRYNELGPAYLYHLAERTFPIDKQAAIEWYWLGHVRARLDALLCSDGTAAQGISYLPGAATSVAGYIRTNPALAGEIGMKVLARDDLYDSKASPIWICSHGVRSMNSAIKSELRKSMSKAERDELGLPPMEEEPAAPLAWLIPEEKMKAVYSRILDGSRRTFERLMEPMEEQVQMFTMSEQPEMVLSGKNIENALWSGSDRIYFAEMIPRKPWKLLRWDGTKTETLADDIGNMTICASGDFISYRTRAPRLPEGAPKPKYDPAAPKTLRYKEGTAGDFRPHVIEYTERTLAPGGFQSAATGRPTYSNLRQSSLTCQWRDMSDLSHAGIYTSAATDLGHGRGFLASYRGREGVDGGTFYFQSVDAQPVKISDDHFLIKCMKELPFKRAIQMGACKQRFVSYRGKKIDGVKVNVALLDFEGTQPTIKTQSYDLIPGERGHTQTLVTKRGIIRLMQSRYTPVGSQPGGLYWYRGDTILKIWEGYPNIADISDNGCKIVFADGKGASRNKDVHVLDICKALPS